jgi:hypothetical protein
MRQDLLHLGKTSFKGAIVEAFNISRQTNRHQPIISIADVEELMCNWEGSTLHCLQLKWINIHSLNTENSEFLKETLPASIIAWSSTQTTVYHQ